MRRFWAFLNCEQDHRNYTEFIVLDDCIVDNTFNNQVKVHTPHAHIFHNITCGCATERDIQEEKIKIAVCQCGAAYLWLEVNSFPPEVFRCYDCGKAYVGKYRKEVNSG